MRSSVVVLLVAAAIACLAGCGASGSAPTVTVTGSTTTASSTTPPGAPGSVSTSAGSTVPLGITPAELEGRLGKPATSLRRFADGFNCTLYRIAEQPPFVKLRYCFRGGRLKFFSTYAVEGR